MSKSDKHLRDRKQQIRRRMIHDLVKDGLGHKSATKLVDDYGNDPITFSVAYNNAINKLKKTDISLEDNEYWPEFSIKDMVPPVFRIKDTYSMTRQD